MKSAKEFLATLSGNVIFSNKLNEDEVRELETAMIAFATHHVEEYIQSDLVCDDYCADEIY